MSTADVIALIGLCFMCFSLGLQSWSEIVIRHKNNRPLS